MDDQEKDEKEPVQMQMISFEELWYEVYSPTYPDFRSSGEQIQQDATPGDGHVVAIGNTFDYAELPDHKWQVYYYISIYLPDVISQTTAIKYEFKMEGFEWEDFFDAAIVRSSLVLSIQTAIEHFQARVKMDELTVNMDIMQKGYMPEDSLIDRMCQDMEDHYYKVMRPFDLENYMAMREIHLSRKYGMQSYTSLKLTFAVLAQILFYHESFNRKHNRKVFFKEVPEMKFYTLWLKCEEMAKGDIAMNGMETSYFLTCVECALQVMVGEKGDRLIPLLTERKFTKEVRDVWFKTSEKLLEAFPKEADAPEDIDWDAVIE
ncbi:MAG: hypothetical protein JSS79_14535 [Bacteroidetes bacterium]|nr:hypothetical protein [Bacteroidota bacterium]